MIDRPFRGLRGRRYNETRSAGLEVYIHVANGHVTKIVRLNTAV
jgi:hypothetical protein